MLQAVWHIFQWNLESPWFKATKDARKLLNKVYVYSLLLKYLFALNVHFLIVYC